jgi:hypothetical protein
LMNVIDHVTASFIAYSPFPWTLLTALRKGRS